PTSETLHCTSHHPPHSRTTAIVAGSAPQPVSSDLLRWSLTVSRQAPTAAAAAKLLRGDVAAVRHFLEQQGVPSNAIAPGVVSSQEQVVSLGHHRRKISYRVSQGLDVSTRKLDVV